MSQAETVLAALVDALAAGSIGASIERDRVIAFNVEDLPAVVVKPMREESSPLGNGLLRCVLDVEIEIHVRGQQPSTLADPFAGRINAALTASPALAGLIGKLFRSAKEWEFSDSDGTGGRLTLTYQIHYVEPA